ncbi:MAG TPA: hypothetical protein VF550_18035 [Polyangia bacterium]
MKKSAVYSIFITLVVSPLLLIGCDDSESKNGTGGSGGGTGGAGGMAKLDGGGTGGETGGAKIDGGAVDAGVGRTDGGAGNTVDGGEGILVDAPSMLVDAGGAVDAPGVDGGAGGAVDSSTCPATGPVCIGNATDDFSSGTLAPHWSPWDNCGTTAVSAGALVLDRPAVCSGTLGGSLGAGLDTCNFKVCGDFDAQIDFALTNFAIPLTASRYAGMNVHSPAAATPAWNLSIERLDSSYINANVPQYENYKAYTTSSVDASSTFVATTDTSGKFRITRVGTTLTAYYWNTSAWVSIRSITNSALADPMLVLGVYAGSDDPTAFTVTFDNFSIAPTVQTSSDSAAINWDGSAGSGGGFNYTQGSYLLGFEFKANRAITVTKLGAYDSNFASLTGGAETFASVPVGLYDMTTHALLGSVTVGAADPVAGVFHFAALTTPVTLNTTDTYAVVQASGTNHYVATSSPSAPLVPADIDSAINYLGFAGHGPLGQTQTTILVEPDYFVLPNLNYDLGPNFRFQ